MPPIVTTGIVRANIAEGEGAFRLWLEAPALAAVAQPGQFVNVRTSDTVTPLLRRPFSFCDIDRDRGAFALLHQVVGPGTRRLSQLTPGMQVSVVGPLGNGFDTDRLTDHSILCAGGIGVAPFPALARTLHGRTKLHAIIGARTEALVLCRNDFSEMDIPVSVATEDGSVGLRGFVTAPLREALEENTAATVYACGPEPMLAAVAELCQEYGCLAQLSVEAVMGCGVGACLSCVFRTPDGRYIRSCVEGPVFGPGEVIF